MGIKKRTSLKMAFWKFLIMLLAGLAAAIVVPFAVFLFSITFGFATYADYSERSVNAIAPIIAASPDLTDVQLPAGCKYMILDKEYNLVETSMEGDDLQRAMEYATTGTADKSLNKQYLLVTRENEFVMLQYYIGSRFTNEWMNEHLPSPEILLYVVIGLNCIAVCAFLTTRFAKNLRSQLLPLFYVTEEVARQNLDFEVGHSKIKEFEDVLVSFSNMKDSLKTSLKQKWKAEQTQKEQIAALAHDLKTPLTIIQGNADLLCETDLDVNQQEYVDYIIDSSEKMQIYIKTLIDISGAAGYQFKCETISVPAYLKGLFPQMDALCKKKNLRLETKITDTPSQIRMDKIMLERAIMNVLNNAVDYSVQNGTIYVHAFSEEGYLQIAITDEGEGFSQEALCHAKEQFYMADQSRNRRMHFGMGLYIANSVLVEQGGQLILENSQGTGGAEVTMKIPCQI